MRVKTERAGKDVRVEAFDGALPAGVAGLMFHGRSAIDATRFVRALVSAWGGEEEIARAVVLEFRRSHSPTQRSQLLRMSLQLIERVSANESRRAPDYSAVPQEELLATAKALLVSMESIGKSRESGDDRTEEVAEAAGPSGAA